MENIWDSISDSEYVRFEDGKEVFLTFTQEPPKTVMTQYGNEAYAFEVRVDGDDKILSVSSIRLMRLLKGFLPLGKKTLSIIRTGEGFNTVYEVKDVTNLNQFL
jgi:hypothetical protein